MPSFLHCVRARLVIARLATALCMPVFWSPAMAAGTATPAAASTAARDWVVSADGTHVLDVRAQLAWPRCVEGMAWTGRTCSGKAALLDRAEAGALAVERWQSEGVGWRLPRAAELQRLIDKSASPPGLNPVLFPAAPGGWHWSATANVNAPVANPYNYGTVMQGKAGEGARQAAQINGWAVNVSSGEARGDTARSSKLPVRLVRPIMPADTAP